MIKKKIITILYKCLEFIEKFEYRNLNLNQNDITKKIIETIEIDINVNSDSGFVKATHLHKTQPYDTFHIVLENRLEIKCADNHILFLENLIQIYCKDLIVGDLIMTKYGISKIKSISKLPYRLSMFDLTIDNNDHRYYSNDILSHNTILSSLFILWYCLFNQDKTIMIIANKGETVTEILDKIKQIYKLIPFFLKSGVEVWNTKSIVFGDTGCRIRTASRTKEPAIGFTIDFLFMDEFAHIPRNIIEPYYKAAFPTVSNVKNSKIIITSTPNGKNLFHKLYTSAINDKNFPYKALSIPWDRNKNRYVTYIKLDPHILNIEKTNVDKILEQVLFIQPESFKSWDNEQNIWIINVPNTIELTPDEVRRIDIDLGETKKNITQLSIDVISWRENEIKAIGSEEAFNQEYGLQFSAGSKRIIPTEVLSEIEKNEMKFEYIDFNHNGMYTLEDITWTTDKSIFEVSQMKNYNIWATIDLAEGLKQDYTVLNIFRQIPIEKEEILKRKISEPHLAFRLVQIGLWRSNIHSISQFCDIFYTIIFELLDSDKCKVVMEMNKNYGNEVLKVLPNIRGGENAYGSYIFARYKHNVNDQNTKVGLLVSGGEGINSTASRPILIRNYIDCLTHKRIMVSEYCSIQEVAGFVKDVLPSGKVIWASDSGNDDIVATIINLCTIFDRMDWRNSCEELLERFPEYSKILYENGIISDNSLLGGFEGIRKALSLRS